MLAAARDTLQAENKTLESGCKRLSKQHSLLKAQYAQEQEVNAHNMRSLMQQERDFQDELEEYREFVHLQPEIMPLHAAFPSGKRRNSGSGRKKSSRSANVREEEARQQAEREPQHIQQSQKPCLQRRRSRMR